METGRPLKPLSPEAGMRESEAKRKRQEQESNGGGGGKGINGTLLVGVGASFIGLANHGRDNLAGTVKQSNRSLSESSKSYIIRFRVGRLPTSSVRRLANLYGTNNVQISSSLSEVTDSKKYLS